MADFTGHGVNAALNTFRLHALIHEHKELRNDPRELLAILNERLVPLLPPGQFATFMYVVIDHRAGELRFSSAGAPPAVLIQGRNGQARLCDADGLPLGIERGVQYPLHQREFPEESMLLLFSDGLSEFSDIDGRRIGDDGVCRALDACHSDRTPQQIIDCLCSAAGITADRPLADDTTIVCLDRRVRAKARAGARRPSAPGAATEARQAVYEEGY
jgi:phosphoserine phosphatase RsbU/P